MTASGTDRYVIEQRVGVGGMAEVFRAVAQGASGFERMVAIKRILPQLSHDAEFIRMFVDEAKITVQLEHPNIVQVFDLGHDDSSYYIAMEFVHGRDLRAVFDRLRSHADRMPLAVAVYVAQKVCEALHYAHFATTRAGQPLDVVHRDITPQNVMVSFDGEVKVTDFGLARAAGRATQTETGIVKGKLAYMPPEAFVGAMVDRRADVYAVGILLWEMIAGVRLFLGENDAETVRRVRSAHVPSLRSIDASVPEELERIVVRALAKDRDARFQTAGDLHDELETFAYASRNFTQASAVGAWLKQLFLVPSAPSGEGVAPLEPTSGLGTSPETYVELDEGWADTTHRLGQESQSVIRVERVTLEVVSSSGGAWDEDVSTFVEGKEQKPK